MKKLCAFLIVLTVFLGVLTGCSSWYQKNESGNLVLITDRAMIKKLVSSRYSGYNGPMTESKDSLTASGSHSTTNTQVQGVDEGDLVKTDGKVIVIVNNQIIRIIDVATSNVVSKIEYKYTDKDTKFYNPAEIFLYKDKLVVLGSISQYNGNVYPMAKDMMIGRPFWIGYQDAYAAVYDLSDLSKPVLLKNYEMTGGYYSARLTDNELMILSNQYNIMLYATDGKETVNDPIVKETVGNTSVSSIDTKTAFALPGKSGDSFVNILKVDLDTFAEPKLSSYLGSIQTIFVDKDNLLIAQYRYVVTNQATYEGKTVTDLLRFDINSLVLKADASIEGYLLNQFSLDIFDGSIRVAATQWTKEGKSSNSVHVFNMALEAQSSIVNLAPGETIRAVRFIEDKGYVVTFENVDPLFVIDLSNPKAIKLTGELKVPGFSTYLHPLSKTVLFGIAEDLEVVPMSDQYGNKWNSVNRFGLKISLFDVSDPSKPLEIASKRVLGQNGYSEASYNHRAVVYDTDKELLYLPFTDSDYTTQVCQTYPGKEGTGDYTYCSYKMESGVKVLRITPTGITIVKSIVVAANNDYTNLVYRVVYVGNKLYAITYSGVMIYDRDTFELLSTVKF
jgi:inhibitor of cysteine peptidase